jgi:hypothetical protein
MTPSSLSSTHHGHIHITLQRSQNWTTHPLHLLLPRHPSLPVHRLPLSRASWNPTTSPGKLFPMRIKHNTTRTRLHPRKRTCLSHIVKRGRTAPLHSEFFGPCHYPDHSAILHHLHHHQHHVARHKYLRTVLRSREDVSCSHRSQPRPLHKSMLRILLYRFFRLFFSSLFGYIDVSHSRITFFTHLSCLTIIVLILVSHLTISIVVCCLKIKIAGINMIDDESRMNERLNVGPCEPYPSRSGLMT